MTVNYIGANEVATSENEGCIMTKEEKRARERDLQRFIPVTKKPHWSLDYLRTFCLLFDASVEFSSARAQHPQSGSFLYPIQTVEPMNPYQAIYTCVCQKKMRIPPLVWALPREILSRLDIFLILSVGSLFSSQKLSSTPRNLTSKITSIRQKFKYIGL